MTVKFAKWPALRFGLALAPLLFAALAATPLAAQPPNEDEWYDPTDWFDGNNVESDDTYGDSYPNGYYDERYGDDNDYDNYGYDSDDEDGYDYDYGDNYFDDFFNYSDNDYEEQYYEEFPSYSDGDYYDNQYTDDWYEEDGYYDTWYDDQY